MANFQNSIMLGIKLPQQKDIQSQLNNLIKELDNSKVQLDIGFKDNSVVQTLEKLNNILSQTKQNASGINLGNISSSLKQVTEEALKLSSELKGVSSVNLKINDGELKNVKVTMQDTEKEAKKMNESLKETNNGSFFGGISSFLASAGIFYGVAQAVQEVKTQLTNCFEQAEKFDQAFTDISITMDISKEQFAGMSDRITAMGIEYGKSSNEILKIARTYANAQSSIDEVMEKVKPDLWLANVSRIDSADITKTLQSVTNQFGLIEKQGMTAEQATTKVSNSLVAISKNMKFDFVDGIKKMTEAVKIGGSIAENAKMSMDDFLSMTGAFIQQSGMSGQEFSNSLKMISARVLKQKELGAEIGLQTKDYADAENALKRFNISTRDDKGLRSLTDILKDTSVAFNKMNDSDRQYMANKLAGVNQSARFIDIMKSMNTQQLLYNATQTDTTALMDAQNKYSESLEGKLGSLKATYEGLMNKIMNSDQAKFLVTEATEFLNVLSQVDGKTIAFIGTIGLATIAISKLVTLNKALIAQETLTGLSQFIGLLTGMATIEKTVTLSTGAMTVALTGAEGAWFMLSNGIKTATANSLAFIATPIGAVLATIGAVIGIASAGFIAYKEHQAELTQQSKDLKDALEGVNTALANGDTKTASQKADTMRVEQKALEDLINTRKKMQDLPEDKFYGAIGGATKSQSIDQITYKINEQIKKIKDAGMAVDETTGKIKELQEVQDKIVNQNIADKIKSETQAQIEHRSNVEANTAEYNKYIATVQDLYSQYQNLSSQENLNTEQKANLSSVVEQLQGKIGGLNVQMKDNGQVYIENTGLITDTISYLDNEGMTVETLTNIRLADQKVNATWQYENSSLTYTETQKRIQIYNAEIEKIKDIMKARLISTSASVKDTKTKEDDNSDDYQNLRNESRMRSANSANQKEINNLTNDVNNLQAGLDAIDKIYSTGSKLPSNNRVGGGGTISANPDTSGSEKKGKSAETLAKEEHEKLVKDEKETLTKITDAYDQAKNKIEDSIEEINYNEKLLGNSNDGDNFAKKMELTNQKLGEQKKVVDEANKQLEALKNTTVSTEEAQKQLTSETLKASKELRNEKLEVASLNEEMKKLNEDQIKKTLETQQKLEEIQMEVKQNKEKKDLTYQIFGFTEDEWNTYKDARKDEINQEISDLQDRVELDDSNVSAKDALIAKQNELNEVDKESYANIKDFQSAYEEIHNQRLTAISDELKALEKTHDAEEKENNLLEKKKALTEAQISLEKAKNDKSLYQYKKNEQTGVWDFEWVVNEETVKTAQDTYDKAKKDLKDYQDNQEYEKEKALLEQRKADEETITNIKKTSYDKQQKALEESQATEKATFENHYSDMDKLVQQEMKDLATKYGDNWKVIYTTIDANLTDVETRYDNLAKMKAILGIDGLTNNTSSTTNKDVYGKVSSNSNGDIIKTDSNSKIQSELQTYTEALQKKLDIMTKYATQMIKVKAQFEGTMLNLQTTGQKAQYTSLVDFSFKYTTFTDKFLEMLQLIYDFRYTNIVNLSTQMQGLIKEALLSCEEAYQKFVDMSEAMGIDVNGSISISSALSEFEKYKASVDDWTKTKEDTYKNEKNNPLTNPNSLADYEAKYNSNANDISKNPLYSNIDSSLLSKYADNYNNCWASMFTPDAIVQMSRVNMNSFGVSSLNSQLGTITNNKNKSSSITNYQIDKIELNEVSDATQVFDSILSYTSQKASLKTQD